MQILQISRILNCLIGFLRKYFMKKNYKIAQKKLCNIFQLHYIKINLDIALLGLNILKIFNVNTYKYNKNASFVNSLPQEIILFNYLENVQFMLCSIM